MMSQIPIRLQSIPSQNLDKEILRTAIIAELDAVSLYEQMAALTGNGKIKQILMDVAREEKTHVGEFQALLLREDPEHGRELDAGEQEVREKETRT